MQLSRGGKEKTYKNIPRGNAPNYGSPKGLFDVGDSAVAQPLEGGLGLV